MPTNNTRPLEFGWFLPTSGDSSAYGLPEASIDASPEHFHKVVSAAEDAGFEYLLIPVGAQCWEAYMAGAFVAAQSRRIAPLIAARPGYVNPVLLAKMIATFDQMSGGRICVNLIAGQAEAEVLGEGIRFAKEDRYALMEEEVSILKALWTAKGPVDFDGQFHTLKGANINPLPLQKPYPRFYLGGGSEEAWNLSAKHSDVHLFWGDTPEQISANIDEIRDRAAQHEPRGQANRPGRALPRRPARRPRLDRSRGDSKWVDRQAQRGPAGTQGQGKRPVPCARPPGSRRLQPPP